MVASKEMLPQSTERVVEVQGTTEAIKVAVLEIGRCLLEDWERGQGTVLYHPGAGGDAGVLAGGGASAPGAVVGRRPSAGFSTGPMAGGFVATSAPTPRRASNVGNSDYQKPAPSAAQSATANAPEGSLRTQNISIPSDMVGCIIGRAGSKITEIRRLSGSKISIAKVPHDETGERMFTIVGTSESNEKALFLLYNQLESEKTRRVEGAEQGEGDE
ncbi:PolyC-binding proteins alphaCP-1 and related KH domain proteins [Phaffia rhodozyma]|uniref:PolyC-binding proteins alphaCP-1 and related KH domain proteins n=1 Tax=Phaffia rhodozyma TaxID=264483 RepID=A0A0F7SSP8_PHARH|nr:PolyC-binding proteins alphaCP-1 and related KH domain proteins [Phaffia rhodozyma]